VQVEQLDERLVRCVAPNGLRVLTEALPGVRSAALGIWVRAGSAHEPPARLGQAHLLEHLVFKGTERRSAQAIARALESRGGTLDAYTSRDYTNYQAHILDTDLAVAVDVLTDLVRRPLLREGDLRTERQVVLEEISSVADTPDDLVFELHGHALWGDHPYGAPILGTRETVTGLSAEDLRAFHRRGYHPGNCVVAAAGSVESDALLDALAREGWLDAAPGEASPAAPPGAARHGVQETVARDTQQCHIVFGTDTVPSSDRRRYAFGLIASAFGGGMSSRLFQRVREELGLAYAVFAFQHFYQAAGAAGVYVGTRPETADLATAAILAEYERLAAEGLPAEELASTQQQMKGQIVLALESPVSRMHRLATLELLGEPYRRIDDVLADIDAVSGEEVLAITRDFFAPDRQTVVRLGPA
jgi:predicted Zn-dependent peptidase